MSKIIIKLKTEKEFDSMYPDSEYDLASHKTGETTTWPTNRLKLLGTIVEVEIRFDRLLYFKNGANLVIKEEMIDMYLTKETNPEYFL